MFSIDFTKDMSIITLVVFSKSKLLIYYYVRKRYENW